MLCQVGETKIDQGLFLVYFLRRDKSDFTNAAKGV